MDRRLTLGLVALFLACGDDSRETSAGSGFVTSASASASATASASASASAGSTGDSEGGSGSDSQGSTGDATTNVTSASSDATSAASDGTTTASSDPTSGDASSGGSDSDTEGACAEVTVMAENKKQPADIIFAIDNSGSMDFEEGEVQSNMNTFSSKIIQSGIDAHVVLISNSNICIAPPLGSGACPVDDKPPSYKHVNDGVGSNNALDKIMQHVPDWQDMMRPDGQKHVVVVSDDNASMAANTFHTMFKALGPSYEDYKFHAIVGTWDVGDVLKCAGDPVCCATIADEGKVYKQLVSLTGGVLGPLCDGGKQKFGELFTTLSMQVVQEATIACEWDIPEPMGMDLDFGKVNVDYLDGMGGKQAIPKVDSADACANLEAWYYDDNDMPTKIYACPALCMKIQANPMAKVDVKFGCESLIPQ